MGGLDVADASSPGEPRMLYAEKLQQCSTDGSSGSHASLAHINDVEDLSAQLLRVADAQAELGARLGRCELQLHKQSNQLERLPDLEAAISEQTKLLRILFEKQCVASEPPTVG